MRLISHECSGYRNIEALAFYPCEQVNVICGENGHGKTNLLESIFLLTGAKSFRGGQDAALIMEGRGRAALSSEFFCGGRRQAIKLDISEKGRTASLNGGSRVNAASLAGRFCCVVFSPEHLSLVKGSPGTRRRFIDTALCQISPVYIGIIKAYNRVAAQRNSLLKDAARVAAALDMLEIYDAQFIASAMAVTEYRARFVSELLPLAERGYAAISNSREGLDFCYAPSLFPSCSGGSLEAEAEEGRRILAELRAEELRAGHGLAGPHRDDLPITLDGRDARAYASQGQQRSLVLALKLAEAALMEERMGERPVLLLDDVLSELDAKRQDYLIKSLSGTQAVVTSCAPELVLSRAKAAVFTMREGGLC
jgi:DNA replication and repair protein RecF